MVLGVFTILLGTTSPAFAASSISNNANTLKITPLRTDLTIAPGKSGIVTVKLSNLTKTAMTVQVIENDFISGDENGTPALILDANQYAPTHSLKRYMVPLQNITVPAGTTQPVTVTINVSADAQPGGYFGAVRFVPISTGASQSVNLNASAASLILMTVPGNAVEKLNMTNFDIQQNGKDGANFRDPSNLQLFVRFTNGGNLQEAPFGNISVTQGKKVVYSYAFNNADPRQEILPDSARRWTIPLKNIGAFGYYTVNATFTYGKNNQTIDVTKSFWVIPWYIIIGSIVGIVVIVAIIVAIWLFLRTYKRRILNGNGRRGAPRR